MNPSKRLLPFSIVASLLLSSSLSFSSTLSEAAGVASFFEKNLPTEKLRCAVTHVEDLIRPGAYSTEESVATENSGMNAHFETLMKVNSCFKNLVFDFWRKHDGMIIGSLASDDSDPILSKDRPNISERAGQGRFSDQKPGWLWKSALESTHGDANQAIALIATCTNDDTGATYSKAFAGDEAKTRIQKFVDEYSARIASLRQQEIGLESYSGEYSMLDSKIQSLNSILTKYRSSLSQKSFSYVEQLRCPGAASSVFAQQSVDESFDLPPDLKARIINAQRPGGNVSTLASKAYHFIAGAALGCELAKCGVSVDQAAFLARAMAMAYRGLTLCPIVKANLQMKNAIAELIQINSDDPSYPRRATAALTDKAAMESLIQKQGGGFDASFKLQKIIQASDAVTAFDAATLYSKWYLGGPDSLIPCTDIRGGPRDLTEHDYSDERGPQRPLPSGGSECGVVGWNVERCAAARKKLNTWDVDFAWTEKQQEIGARFGASKCSPLETSTDGAPGQCPHGISVDSNKSPATVVH